MQHFPVSNPDYYLPNPRDTPCQSWEREQRRMYSEMEGKYREHWSGSSIPEIQSVLETDNNWKSYSRRIQLEHKILREAEEKLAKQKRKEQKKQRRQEDIKQRELQLA